MPASSFANNRTRARIAFMALLCVLGHALPTCATAADEAITLAEVRGGVLLLAGDEPERYEPATTVGTNVHIRIAGPVAHSVVQQTFRNPRENWVDALYAFPVPEDAAITQLRLRIGERVVEGEVQERVQAQRTFERARAEGKRAALLEQHRPNLFTTAAANIPPGGKVVVEFEYQQTVRWRDGTFSIVQPTAVTPRYVPATTRRLDETISVAGTGNGWAVLPGELPNSVPMDRDPLAEEAHKPAFALSVTLNPGFPLSELGSPSHNVEIKRSDAQHVITVVEPNGGDRDFTLRWTPTSAAAPRAAFFAESGPRGDYGLLMVMPPQQAFERTTRIPRQVTFVLDKSGSMAGASMRQAKAALTDALYRLHPDDEFDVVAFDSSTHAFFGRMTMADAGTVQRAVDRVARIEADGGTAMAPALEQTFAAMPDDRSRLQQIVFVTDGAVGNEAELFALIERRLGSRRLFTVGIGSAPNHHFMTEAAHFGRGTFVQISNAREVQEKMRTLLDRIEHAALTGLALNLPGARMITPNPLPDLYRGEPVVALMALDGEPSAGTLNGRIGDVAWSTQLSLSRTGTAGVETRWARERIQHWMRQRVLGTNPEDVRREVLAIALEHQLVSPFTSLVAVDRTPIRPVDADPEAEAVDANAPAGRHAPPTVQLAQGATLAPLLRALGLGLLLLVLTGMAIQRLSPRSATA